jgi:hypothetical protein
MEMCHRLVIEFDQWDVSASLVLKLSKLSGLKQLILKGQIDELKCSEFISWLVDVLKARKDRLQLFSIETDDTTFSVICAALQKSFTSLASLHTFRMCILMQCSSSKSGVVRYELHSQIQNLLHDLPQSFKQVELLFPHSPGSNAFISGVRYSPTSRMYAPTSLVYSRESSDYSPSVPVYSPSAVVYSQQSPSYTPRLNQSNRPQNACNNSSFSSQLFSNLSLHSLVS